MISFFEPTFTPRVSTAISEFGISPERYEDEIRFDPFLAVRRADDDARNTPIAVVFDSNDLRAFPKLDALFLHAIAHITADLAVRYDLQAFRAHRHDGTSACRTEKGTVFNRRLAAADHDNGCRRFVVEDFDKADISVNALEVLARNIEKLRPRP